MICSFPFCLMLFFTCFSIPSTCSCSKCSEAFYAELSGSRASPRGADSATGASLSPQPKHHWLWFTSPQTLSTLLTGVLHTLEILPKGQTWNKQRQEARCTPAPLKHVVWCRGLVHRWKGKKMLGGLSEGSSIASSKLPEAAATNSLQAASALKQHLSSPEWSCWKEKSVQRETLVLPQEKNPWREREIKIINN